MRLVYAPVSYFLHSVVNPFLDFLLLPAVGLGPLPEVNPAGFADRRAWIAAPLAVFGPLVGVCDLPDLGRKFIPIVLHYFLARRRLLLNS